MVRRAQQAWRGDWHAVWLFEWMGAPLEGPLVAEVWHAADGRLRIETLEASSPSLSGLSLIDNGQTSWLSDPNGKRLAEGEARVPMASDALDAIDWLLTGAEDARVNIIGQDALESGRATRLAIRLTTGDRAKLWLHNDSGLPCRVELDTANWGEASFAARSITATQRLHPGLFKLP